MPTEAQWEYACLAGSGARYCYGSDKSGLGEYAWFDANSESKTHPAGEKKPNAWGLYDMHGNVAEWCHDWHDVQFYANGPTDDPTGPAGGTARVVRGGFWGSSAWGSRSACRDCNTPRRLGHHLGLRVSLVPAGEPQRNMPADGFRGLAWKSPVPEDCPFPKSTRLTGIYFTGRHSDYRCGDTFYPCWASDGNLYSPWTDGKTDGVGCSSGDGAGAKTGHAVMIGDDPLRLEIHNTSPPKQASALPYQGRYPAGSLVYNGTWYYGTYCLGPAGSHKHNEFVWNWPNLGVLPVGPYDGGPLPVLWLGSHSRKEATRCVARQSHHFRWNSKSCAISWSAGEGPGRSDPGSPSPSGYRPRAWLEIMGQTESPERFG